MNILLWVLQVALALLCLAGGTYKVFKFDELASTAFYSVVMGSLAAFVAYGRYALRPPA
jgi:hypothetical protein